MNTKFDEELKDLSIYVYQNGKGKIPQGWKRILKEQNPGTGFYSEAFYRNGEIVIVYRGTGDETDKVTSDLAMFTKLMPAQKKDAQKMFDDVQKKYSSKRIVLTGHSLGGSLAQLVSAVTGRKAVTF